MITMPTWVFLLLLIGGIAWNAFLMWANHDQAHEIRWLRSRTHRQNLADLDEVMRGGLR